MVFSDFNSKFDKAVGIRNNSNCEGKKLEIGIKEPGKFLRSGVIYPNNDFQNKFII